MDLPQHSADCCRKASRKKHVSFVDPQEVQGPRMAERPVDGNWVSAELNLIGTGQLHWKMNLRCFRCKFIIGFSLTTLDRFFR